MDERAALHRVEARRAAPRSVPPRAGAPRTRGTGMPPGPSAVRVPPRLEPPARERRRLRVGHPLDRVRCGGSRRARSRTRAAPARPPRTRCDQRARREIAVALAQRMRQHDFAAAGEPLAGEPLRELERRRRRRVRHSGRPLQAQREERVGVRRRRPGLVGEAASPRGGRTPCRRPRARRAPGSARPASPAGTASPRPCAGAARAPPRIPCVARRARARRAAPAPRATSAASGTRPSRGRARPGSRAARARRRTRAPSRRATARRRAAPAGTRRRRAAARRARRRRRAARRAGRA